MIRRKFLQLAPLYLGIISLYMFQGCVKKISPADLVFKVEWSQEPPTNWDVVNSPVFRVSVRPNVPISYDNDSVELVIRMSDGATVRWSSPVMGYAGSMHGSTVFLDIGGNIYSSYRSLQLSVEAHLWRNGSIDSTKRTLVRTISFTPLSATQTINVEYDHQTSFDIFDLAFGGRNIINEVFEAADTRLNIVTNQDTLTDAILPYHSDPDIRKAQFLNYVQQNHQLYNSGYHMYLVVHKM